MCGGHGASRAINSSRLAEKFVEEGKDGKNKDKLLSRVVLQLLASACPEICVDGNRRSFVVHSGTGNACVTFSPCTGHTLTYLGEGVDSDLLGALKVTLLQGKQEAISAKLRVTAPEQPQINLSNRFGLLNRLESLLMG